MVETVPSVSIDMQAEALKKDIEIALGLIQSKELGTPAARTKTVAALRELNAALDSPLVDVPKAAFLARQAVAALVASEASQENYVFGA